MKSNAIVPETQMSSSYFTSLLIIMHIHHKSQWMLETWRLYWSFSLDERLLMGYIITDGIELWQPLNLSVEGFHFLVCSVNMCLFDKQVLLLFMYGNE